MLSNSPQKPELIALSRLYPAPWNPRTISDDRFKKLCESIKADPDFLWLRPIIASLSGEIAGGNMRYRAVQALGWTEVPALIVDMPEKLARERALRDNNSWGEWQDEGLQEILHGLAVEGSDLTLLGFEDKELGKLLDSIGTGLGGPEMAPPGVGCEHECKLCGAKF